MLRMLQTGRTCCLCFPQWMALAQAVTLPAGTERAKTEKLKKYIKPYRKLVGNSCLWDFGRCKWSEIILGSIPLKLSQNLVLKIKNMNFFLFPQYYGVGPRKVECLRTSHTFFSTGLFPSEPPQKVSADGRCLHFSFKEKLNSISQILFKT